MCNGDNKGSVGEKQKKTRWNFKRLLYEGQEIAMTAAAGIPMLLELFLESSFFEPLVKALPQRVSNNSYDTRVYALLFFAGFLRGHDCIEDWAELKHDAGVMHCLQELPCTQALRDFLKDFEKREIEGLNDYLVFQAFKSRKALKKSEAITFDIDTTSHEQSGKKIEGVGYNYKNQWCLESLQVIDELGLCYGFELRSGGTFSSEGSVSLLKPILEHARQRQYKKIYIRGDSAFCFEDMIRLGLAKDKKGRKIYFTLTAHDRMNWREKVCNGAIQDWQSWVYTEKEKKAAQEAGVSLPKVEVGRFYYEPGFAEGKVKLPLLVKRTWSQNKETREYGWVYYGVLCNWDLFFHSVQEIFEFHFGRCTSENIFKEEKLHYEIDHFKCRKLLANHAYGQLAMITHNFMRLIAHLDSPEKPHFIKALRRKLIEFPGKLLGKTQNWRLQIPNYFAREVTRIRHAWETAVLYSLDTS